MSQGVAPMSEPITVTYLDLERLIDTCGLEKNEKEVVELLMQGYTKGDIADLSNNSVEVIKRLFDQAVDKIIEQNEYEWHRCNTRRRLKIQ